MPVTRQYIGRRITTTPDGGLGVVSAGTMRVTVFEGPSQHLWIEKIGARVGKGTSINANAQLVVFDAEGGLDDRIARTSSQALSVLLNLATGSGGGANIAAALAVSDNGPSVKGALARSGRDIGIGFLALTADIGHGMEFIGGPGVSGDVNLYDKYGLSSVPTDWGSIVGSPEGQLSAWLECWTNEAPRVPVERSPSGTISTLTPEFKSTGRDRNGKWGPNNDGFDSGDQIGRVRIEWRVVGSSTLFWSKEYIPTLTEMRDGRADNAREDDHLSYLYDGVTVPTRGVNYEWRTCHWDSAGAQGSFSDWLAFTISTAGSVTYVAPVGKQTTLQPTISGRWTHATSAAMTAVQVRVRSGSSGGAILDDSGEVDITDVASSATPGTLFNLSFATLGLDPLSWESTFVIEMRGKDTGSLWSVYKAGSPFTTDRSPTIPSVIYPGSATVTDLPLVSFPMSDLDDDPEDVTGRLVIGRNFGEPANAGFEDGTLTNWTSAAVTNITHAFTRDTAIKHSGAASGKIVISSNTAGAGAAVNPINNDAKPCVAGQTVGDQIWVYTSTTAIHPRAQVRFYNASNVFISSSTEPDYTPGAINTWDHRSWMATAPVGAVTFKMAVFLYMPSASTTGTVYLDDGTMTYYSETIVDAPYESLTGLYEHQIDPTDFPQFGTYSLAAYGFDGILYSGGATVEANAARSAVWTVQYIDGPSVDITSHTSGDTITTVRPVITYDAATQVRRQVSIYDQATGKLVRRSSSGLEVTGSHSYQPSAGYIHQGMTLIIEVIVEDAFGLQATAQVNSILVDIPAPDILEDVTLEPVVINNEPEATALRMRWKPSEISLSEWRGYITYRRDLVNPIDRITAQNEAEFIHYLPTSGTEFEFGVSQWIEVDGEAIESDIVWISGSVTFKGIVLCDARNPSTYRLYSQPWDTRRVSSKGRESKFDIWDGNAPLTVRTEHVWQEWSFVCPFANYRGISAALQEERAWAIHRQGGPICYRDGYGRRDFISLDRDGGLGIEDARNGRRIASFKGQTELYTEGVTD